MRIALVSTYPPTECGIATYSQYLTGALRDQGEDVYVVSQHGASGHQVFSCFNSDDADLDRRVTSMATRFSPDVVHVQHEYGLFGRDHGVSVVPMIMKFRFAGLPVTTTLHSVYEEVSTPHELILHGVLNASSRVIVHEEYQRDTLESTFPEELTRDVRVVPHGARELQPIPDARRTLNLPPDRKLILMIGYFRRSKNFERIIRVMPEVRRRYPNAALVLASRVRGTEFTDYRREIMEMIEESSVRDSIYVMQGEMPQNTFDTVLSAADVVALPYREISQSGIMAHAFAFGKPMVTSQTTVTEHILSESGAGFPCRDDGEYVENIVRLLSDEALYESMAANARQYVEEKIGWSTVARQHRSIYDECRGELAADLQTIRA